MIFPKRGVIHEKGHFAVIGSIIAVTAILVTAGATTQLAFAAGPCSGCTLSASGSGSLICGSCTIPDPGTISFSATKGKGGDVSGTLTITRFIEGISQTSNAIINAGKISGAKYSLQGTEDPNGPNEIYGGLPFSFSVSGPIGTQVPIKFQDFNASGISGSFTGTAQTTPPT